MWRTAFDSDANRNKLKSTFSTISNHIAILAFQLIKIQNFWQLYINIKTASASSAKNYPKLQTCIRNTYKIIIISLFKDINLCFEMYNFLANRIRLIMARYAFGRELTFSSCFISLFLIVRVVWFTARLPRRRRGSAHRKTTTSTRVVGVRFVLRLRESRVIAGFDLAGGLQLRFFAARQLSHRSSRRRKRVEVIAAASIAAKCNYNTGVELYPTRLASIALPAIHLGAHYFASYESISAIPGVSLAISRG